MKRFSEYLAESTRNYSYIVKLAFKPTEEMMNKIEQVLAKYDLVSITNVKSLPIKKMDQDFPNIKNPETYSFNIEVSYPAPAHFIKHTISSLGLAMEEVCVLSGSPDGSLYFPNSQPSHSESMNKEEEDIEKNTSETPLLQKNYDPQDNAVISGENYGDSYNDKLVKNSIGSTDQMIPVSFKKTKGLTLNDPRFKIGTKSAMGSEKPKLPTIKSFAR